MPHFLRTSVCAATRSSLSLKLHFAVPLFLVFLIFARPAAADTLYTYIGGNFDNIQQPVGDDQWTTSDHVVVTFTVSGPPLICLTSCSITAEGLSIRIQSMGVLVLSGHSFRGSNQTASSGNTVAWIFE